MKRPVGVILTAFVQCLGSLFTFVIGVVILLAPRALPRSSSASTPPNGTFYLAAFIYFAMAAVGVATAIGLFRRKRWSRYSTLVFAALLLAFALVLVLTFAFMPFPTPTAHAAALPRSSIMAVRTSMIGSQLVLMALAALWLYYFNTAAIREWFAGVDSASESRRPVSIVVLGVLTLIGLPGVLWSMWAGLPAMLFGVLVEGNAARITYLVLLALALYIGIGLLRLAPASRKVAIAYYAFGALNLLLFNLLPGRDLRLERILAASSHAAHSSAALPSSFFAAEMWLTFIACLVFFAIATYFLVTRRCAFEPGPVACPPEIQIPTSNA